MRTPSTASKDSAAQWGKTSDLQKESSQGRRHSSGLDWSSRCWAWIFQGSSFLAVQQLAWTRCGGLKYLLAVWAEVAGYTPATSWFGRCVLDRIVFFAIA